jgi:CDP-glucose 4,6-dehydratase
LMGSGLELDIENTARNEIGRQCLSARKARTVLQWKPQFTLEEGLQRTIRWYKDFFRTWMSEESLARQHVGI